MQVRDKIYIFDISNFIHRSFHVHTDMSTSYGFPTGAIWGTLNMMLRFIEKYKPKHILICYDAQTAKSVRKDIYPLYKANRVQVQAVSQEERIIRRFFEMLCLPSVELEGYEADDLIATATYKLKQFLDVVIVTGDKDMLQLIEPGVEVFDQMKNIYYDEAEALKKFGVRADQIADYLAIAGDAADNIPGVMGIGPKGAAKLLGQYGSVFGIYENINSVESKLKKKLEDSRENAFTSYLLTVLHSDLPVVITPDSVRFIPIDNPEIYALLDKLEFTNIRVKIELMWQSYSEV